MDTLIATSVFNVLLVFTRLGFAVMLLPGFGAAYVTPRVRLVVAFMLALVVAPLVEPVLPPEPESATVLVLLLVSEVLIGTFIALVVNLLFAALHLAGTSIGFASGLMNAQAFDPNTTQTSALILQLLTMMALVLIFILNLHHLMIRALVESYSLFPPGVLPPLGDFVAYGAQVLTRSFHIGWQLSAPMVIFTIVFYVGMGLMARLMPQLNVFFVSLPLKILTGLGILFVILPAVMLVFLRYFEDGLVRLSGL
nr:flagellar biosynthetic protein FliR [Roseospira goensis]